MTLSEALLTVKSVRPLAAPNSGMFFSVYSSAFHRVPIVEPSSLARRIIARAVTCSTGFLRQLERFAADLGQPLVPLKPFCLAADCKSEHRSASEEADLPKLEWAVS